MITRYDIYYDSMVPINDGEFVMYDDMIGVFKELASKGLLDKEAYQIILDAIAGEEDA